VGHGSDMKPIHPRPAAAILDMDGLMLDTEPIYHHVWTRLAQDLGFQLGQEVLLDLTGRNNDECERRIAQALGPAFPLASFQGSWRGRLHAYIRVNGIAPKPGLSELLDLFEAWRVPTAVATSSHRADTNLSLQAAGLEGRFQAVVTGDEIANGKPAPDIYLAAAARLGVDPPACLAFEDSEAGALAAIAAGMQTIIVPDLKQPSSSAVAGAYRVLPSLHAARELILETWG
jgi:HAD superfamily hydrolase (TIGR01509 family)